MQPVRRDAPRRAPSPTDAAPSPPPRRAPKPSARQPSRAVSSASPLEWQADHARRRASRTVNTCSNPRMELWIPITLTAALFQTWRTALQQRLRGLLSVNAAGFVRYLYALPPGFVLLFGSYRGAGIVMPVPDARF